MTELSRPYTGRSQNASASPVIRKCGCGVVAMADLLLYLTGWDAPDYGRFCRELLQKYVPVLPPFGATGLSLVLGFNRYCRLHKLPYTARWNAFRSNLWAAMEEMLANGIPVILAIGPNLTGQKLNLYRNTGRTYTAAARTKAHFVTVTAMDDRWLQVCSWGRKYYIYREEYWNYAKKHSGFLTSNLLYITTPSCPL